MSQVGAPKTSEALGKDDPRWRRALQAFFTERFKAPLRIGKDGRVELRPTARERRTVPQKFEAPQSNVEMKINNILDYLEGLDGELVEMKVLEE